jgi:chromosome segregation ATPase
MSETVFLLALGIAGTTLVLVAGAIAGAIRGRGSSRSDVAGVKERLDQQAAALAEAQNDLASQSAQLAELQERLDFTERLLTQARDRAGLKPGEERDQPR